VLRIDPAAYQELRRHGEEAYPHESCGVLLGRVVDDEARVAAALVRCDNARTDSPQNRYHIDPRDLLRIQRQGRERGHDIVGFYHSHPDHPARPSGTDLAEAHWLGCSYVITSVAGGKAEATASFLLAGGGEQEKRFLAEEIELESP
jgi:proteasome lid subunit RPN8/RPN11